MKVLILGGSGMLGHKLWQVFAGRFDTYVTLRQGFDHYRQCKLLSEADLLYCPYWFDPVFETEARLSFASKLTTYFAAGRPVLFHGPDYAAPAAFLKENDAGFICNSNNQPRIIDALNTLAADEELCFRLASNARLAFDKHLTLDTLRSKFAEFLGVDENFLLPVT